MALEKEEEEGKEVLYDREDGGKGEGGSASKDAEERGGDAESCKTWMGERGRGTGSRRRILLFPPFFDSGSSSGVFGKRRRRDVFGFSSAENSHNTRGAR